MAWQNVLHHGLIGGHDWLSIETHGGVQEPSMYETWHETMGQALAAHELGHL